MPPWCSLKMTLRPADLDAIRSFAFGVIALLTCLSLVSCGKAGAPAHAAGSTTTTLAQFDALANEICRTMTREQEAIERRSRDPGETGEAVWHELVAASRSADNEVRALPKPPAQANVLDHLVVAYFQEAQDEEEIASAYRTNEADRIQAAFATFLSLARRDADVARSLGMIACAKAEPEERVRGIGRTA
jgi:hypothetical protein